MCDRVQQLRLPRLSEFPADGGNREDQREGEDDVPGRLVAEKFNGGLWLLRVGGKEVVLLVALEVREGVGSLVDPAPQRVLKGPEDGSDDPA